MRKLGQPDQPHQPRNEIEAHICAVLQLMTGQDISDLQTRDEYRDSHWNQDEAPIDPGYAFVVKTSKKFKNWYCKGWEYGVNVEDGKITAIQEIGEWMA